MNTKLQTLTILIVDTDPMPETPGQVIAVKIEWAHPDGTHSLKHYEHGHKIAVSCGRLTPDIAHTAARP